MLFNIFVDHILEYWFQKKNTHMRIPMYDDILNYQPLADDIMISSLKQNKPNENDSTIKRMLYGKSQN